MAALIVGMLLTCCRSAVAELRLPHIFTDHMVLQREQPIRVWGWAETGTKVTVMFAGKKVSAVADHDNRWMATLPAQQATKTADQLVVQSDDGNVTLKNIVVGDVWLMGGQSNMNLPMNDMQPIKTMQRERTPIEGFDLPLVRFFTIGPNCFIQPQEDFRPTSFLGRVPAWQPMDNQNMLLFSAISTYFGRYLHTELDVPIGLIDSSWGGTLARTWCSREELEKIPEMKVELEAWDQKTLADDDESWVKHGGGIPYRNGPALSFNGKIHPIRHLGIKGAVYYQGENNALYGNHIIYKQTLPAVIRSWRAAFNRPDLPIGLIQMQHWGSSPLDMQPMGVRLTDPKADIRDAQLNTHLSTPNTGLVVIFDLGFGMHTWDKKEDALRLGRWALNQVYGKKDIKWRGPRFDSLQQKDGRLVVSFKERTADDLRYGKALTGYTVTKPRAYHFHYEYAKAEEWNKEAPLQGFLIAGEDKEYKVALGRIVGKQVELWHPDVPKPVATRYAWGFVQAANLSDGDLPASPFRTDDWVFPPMKFDRHLGQTTASKMFKASQEKNDE